MDVGTDLLQGGIGGGDLIDPYSVSIEHPGGGGVLPQPFEDFGPDHVGDGGKPHAMNQVDPIEQFEDLALQRFIEGLDLPEELFETGKDVVQMRHPTTVRPSTCSVHLLTATLTSMKICVSGKGGSGKTTISGTLARLAAQEGRKVIAIDADTNPNLALTLGVDGDVLNGIEPLPHGLMTKTEIDGEQHLTLSIAAGELTRDFGFDCGDNVTLMMVGQVRGAGTGCMCSSHATVRGLLHELPTDDSVVIVDAEASPEHLSRATVEAAELQLVVAEPYFKSLETARRYAQLGRDLGIPNIYVIANKVRDADDEEAIRIFCTNNGMELFAIVPFDPSLAEAERAGLPPIEHAPDSPAVGALRQVFDRLAQHQAARR